MKMTIAGVIAAMLALAVLAGPAPAQTWVDFIGIGVASYHTAANWEELLVPDWPPDGTGTNRVPDANTYAFVRNGATASVSANGQAYALYVGGAVLYDPNDSNNPILPRNESGLIITGGSLGIVTSAYIGQTYKGTATQSGGELRPVTSLVIGATPGSTGSYTLTGGTIVAATTAAGGISMANRANSVGTFTMSGGSVWTRDFTTGGNANDPNDIGRPGGVGTINLSGGSMYVNNQLGMGSTPNVSNIPAAAGGKGTFNMTGGTLLVGTGYPATVRVGGQGSQFKDPNTGVITRAQGTFKMTGGSVLYHGDGPKYSWEVGYRGSIGYFEITGGTWEGVSGTVYKEGARIRVGRIDGNFAREYGCKGTMYVGQNAVIRTDDLELNDYGDDRMIMEVSATGNSKVVCQEEAYLGTTYTQTSPDPNWPGPDPNNPSQWPTNKVLEMKSIGGFRPKQSDQITIINVLGVNVPGGVTALGGSGNFNIFESNITNGLDPNYSSAFTGAWVAGAGQADDYVVTFRGYTEGDADGSGSVGLIDLGRVSLNYGLSGKTWADGDFTGEGSVGLVDLGKLSLNYGWTKPAGAPVPEPVTMALLGLGGLALIRRRR